MGVKKETSLQERIQKLIERRGGYVKKNWGNMTSEPGIADLTFCYKGLYIALEVKVDDNEPTKAQGIHARLVQKANGITAAVWSVKEAEKILDVIDRYCEETLVGLSFPLFVNNIKTTLSIAKIDNGTRY